MQLSENREDVLDVLEQQHHGHLVRNVGFQETLLDVVQLACSIACRRVDEDALIVFDVALAQRLVVHVAIELLPVGEHAYRR